MNICTLINLLSQMWSVVFVNVSCIFVSWLCVCVFLGKRLDFGGILWYVSVHKDRSSSYKCLTSLPPLNKSIQQTFYHTHATKRYKWFIAVNKYYNWCYVYVCTDKHTYDTKYSNECLFNVVQIQTSLMFVLCVSIGNTNK